MTAVVIKYRAKAQALVAVGYEMMLKIKVFLCPSNPARSWRTMEYVDERIQSFVFFL